MLRRLACHLQELVDVVSDVIIHQRGVQHLEVSVVDILEDEAWCLRLGVSDHIKQLYDVGASTEILQDLDFSLDLHRQLQGVRGCAPEAMHKMRGEEATFTFFFFTGFRILMMQF